MTTTTPTLTPAQVHELGLLAVKRNQNIHTLVSPPHQLQHIFETYLFGAYDSFLGGEHLIALDEIRFVIRSFYNYHVELRTPKNRKLVHSMFLEISGDELLAKSIFFHDELTEDELREIERRHRWHLNQNIKVEGAETKRRAKFDRENQARRARAKLALQEQVSV